jgi:hypothetical protein
MRHARQFMAKLRRKFHRSLAFSAPFSPFWMSPQLLLGSLQSIDVGPGVCVTRGVVRSRLQHILEGRLGGCDLPVDGDHPNGPNLSPVGELSYFVIYPACIECESVLHDLRVLLTHDREDSVFFLKLEATEVRPGVNPHPGELLKLILCGNEVVHEQTTTFGFEQDVVIVPGTARLSQPQVFLVRAIVPNVHFHRLVGYHSHPAQETQPAAFSIRSSDEPGNTGNYAWVFLLQSDS